MSTSALVSIFKAFGGRVWQSTAGKWIDIVIFAVPIVAVIIFRPVSAWEAAAPFIWAIACILAVHWVGAVRHVWKQVGARKVRETKSPILLADGTHPVTSVIDEPSGWFRLKLCVDACAGILLLGLLSYGTRILEANSLLTYVYLIPTPGLVECQQRAFFVKVHGPQHVSGLQITLKDNRSGQISFRKYSDLDADTASEYFWVTPFSPWNEDYTATIGAHGLHSSQTLSIHSFGGEIRLATSVTIPGDERPVQSCRDAPQGPGGNSQQCSDLLKSQPNTLENMGVDNYQSADGTVKILHVKELPSPSELDEQSDDRHLTEYQRQIIEPVLLRFPGTHLSVFFAGGPKSKAYAEEFQDVFHAVRWRVSRPEVVPQGNERIIDVQMSVSDNYLQGSGEADKTKELLNAFEKAGIKHRHHFATDPNIPDGDMVLWIGPRSPKNVGADQCATPQLKQRQGEPHTCELIRQTTGVCPFVPK
jgi:hypothetical protein